MDVDELKKILYAVEDIARAAGREIMTHYAGTTVYVKEDGSSVTDADHAAENIILPALKKLTPHIPIVSEERVAAGEIPDISGGTFWTVDPLDGTDGFIKKTGEFVVAIALVIDNKVRLGILYHPTTGILHSGAGPGTASRVDASGLRTPLTAAKKPAEEIEAIVKTNADLDRIKGYLTKQFSKASKIATKAGSLLSCHVAESEVDMAIVYPLRRNGRTKWWDVAPGHALVEAAGGRVETLEGLPLLYKDDDLQVPPHVILAAHQVKAPRFKDSPQI